MIIRRFEEKVERHKDNVAVKAGDIALTYGELNRLANRIAYTITSRYDAAGLDGSEQTAALLFNKGVSQVAALLGVLKARKIYVPFDITYPRKRLETMLIDSDARMILADRGNMELAVTLASAVNEDIIIINIDGIDEIEPCDNPNIEGSPDQIAYILYTSGSTGKPKGVVQTCRNVVFYTDNYIKALSITPADRLTFISSFSHDGAVQDIYASILSGAALYPIDIKKEPAAEISRILIKEKITVYHSVSTIFHYFMGSLEGAGTLSSLRLMVTGGEPLRQADVSCVKKLLPGVLLAHMYGQTESSVNTMGFIDVEKEGAAVTIGDALEGVELLLVKEDGEEVIGSETGEIVVVCDFIAPGYWRNPDASAASFLYDEELGKVYRTGDLGRFHYSGKIEFTGRKDNQVKIRGYRVEPREIETLLQGYEGIQEAVAAAGDAAETKVLCAYFTAGEEIKASTLRDFLSRELPEYMIPVHFVQVEQMPLTPGGKIDRNALPVPVIGDKAGFTAPRNAVEENLSGIWSEVLGLGKEIIGIDSNFFELGGHSLNILQLTAQVHKKMSVRVPLAEIFERPTIRQLARYVSNTPQEKYTSIEPVEEREYYPLSSAQKRLYFLQQMDVSSTAYNLFYTFPLGKAIEIKKLEAAIKKLIARHESLRTSFITVNDEPVQRVHDQVKFKIDYSDLAAKNAKEREEEDIIGHLVFPFALSRAPLVRSGLVRLPDHNHTWLVDIHHIVSDGTSHMILTEDFLALYNGGELGSLPLRYKDFVRWQNDLFKGGKIKAQENYWLELYGDAGEISRLRLPADYRRPEVFTYAGDICGFTMGGEDAVGFRSLASGHGGTLYMNMLTVLNVLFYKYSGQTDIIIGAGIAGRPHPDLQGIIGMFVNILAMRNYPGGEKTYESFFKEVIAGSVGAFENQDIQFEELVEKLDVERDTSRNPLFDILMVAQNFRPAAAVEGENLSSAQESRDPAGHRYPRSAAKFDMTFFVFENAQDIYIDIEYYTGIFKEETIRRMISHVNNVIQAVVKNPSIKLKDIDILSVEERKQVLDAFNDTEKGYPWDKTIRQLFEEQAGRTPDRVAVAGHGCMDAWMHGGVHISYGELNKRSDQVARVLKEKGVRGDDVVAIMIERSIEMIIGIIGILKSDGAYLPIEPDLPQERIDFMLKDSNAGILVSEVSEVSEVNEVSEEVLTHPTQLCYVIYTSGSTGKPRGVLTTHYNVIRVVRDTNYIYLTGQDRILQLSNYAFDGSVFDIYGALLNGAALILVPGNKAVAVDHLAEIIKKENITVFFVTTALFNLLVEEEPGIFANIKKVLFGGERVSVEHTRSALSYSGKDKVIHVYGPTETTVYATYYFVNEVAGDIGTVPIGRPLSNTTVYILDNYFNPVPIGVVAELYIGGYGTARGYLNNPELTNEKFLRGSRGQFFQKEPPGRRRQKIYKTGDLGRWLADGNIEFSGRMDQQVKIRGFRVELGEIEYRLMKHGQIKEAVVIDLEEKVNDGGDKYLCAYIVSDNEWGGVELREYLSGILPGYMIPSFFVNVDRIPLTRNGKVDRKKLPGPGIAAGENYAAPGNEVEKKLVGIWREVLSLDVNASIGIDDNFFHLGGHSLKATILVSKIHKNLDVKVPLAEVFKSPTIRGLSEYIQKARKTGYESIEPVEKKEYYSLSSAQKRMYFLQQLDVYSTGYNVPMVLPLGKDIEIDEFASTIKKLIARHESLRTSFVIIDEEPVQGIHDHVEFEIEFFDLAAKNAKEREEEEKVIHRFVRVFDLSQAPLIRVGIFRLPEGYSLLIVDMHHIITDGISREVLREDFINLARGGALEPLRIQYKDFSHWQNHLIASGGIKAQEDYWLELYKDAGEIPRLRLPTDDKRPEFFTFSGAHYGFTLAGEGAAGFKALGSRYGATLYMNMLTALNTLFYKYTGQRDIVMGTGIGGRRHADLQRIIGMFINTLVMRNYPRGEKTYESFLEEVIANSVDAFENQDVQFEELVDKLEVERDTSRNPLFDISMVVQDFKPAITGEELSPHEHKQVDETAKFDMTFFIMEYDEGVYIDIEYYTGIFKEETIRRLALHLKNVVKTVASNPSVRLRDIDILSLEERRRILDEFNDTERRYPGDKTIHELFKEQAERSCDGPAVVCMPHVITFRELDKKSNQAAFLLRKKGVRPDTIVGIMVEPSIEMVVGILGILKAGGAYLPIDPGYPQERIDYMLTDSSVEVLLSEVSGLSKEPTHLTYLTHPTHLCYVIYTSGTTGRPKGVAVGHRGAVNTLICRKEEYDMTPQDVSLQLFSYSFDGFVTSFFTPLLSGVRNVVMGDSGIKDIAAIRDVIIKEGVTRFISVPALYRAIIENLSPGEAGGLKVITLAGDRLSPGILELSKQKNSGLEIAQEYGVTEAAVMSTLYRHQEKDDMIKIGAPVWNTRIYIVNQDRGLQPVGAAGELCIAGDGLARGYINKPELTADKFRTVFYRSYRSYRSYIPKKIYKTGDLARWLPDGNIEFLGRVDYQVKVRGFRIELAEIEYRLMRHDKIKEAVVMDRQDADGGGNYLCAYIVLFGEVEAAELKEYLSANLPDYMIPVHFVPVESIPLTLHGKVDRKKLPGPEMQAVVKYAPPGNDVEKKLVEIWSEVIGVPQPIGIDDNFFELGGHSLKAAILTAKIHEELGVSIPLAELFKRQSIRKLAEFLLESAAEDKKQAPVDDRLVLLRKGTGEANNMFFIHAGSGDVEVYVEFCNHLHPGFNYWGIRISAGRWEDPAPRHWTIESLAREYVQTIKNLQPHGPYRLGGWCIGGTIAFEMVRQLEQMGERIDFFAMIDSGAPNITLARTTKGSSLEVVDRFEENGMDVETIKSKVPGPIREAMPDIEQLDIREIIYYWKVIRSLEYARNVYIPEGKISTAVHFFGAGYTGGIGKDKYSRVKQWNDYTTGVIKFNEVHGDHYSLFRTPHVVPFAEMFNKEIVE